MWVSLDSDYVPATTAKADINASTLSRYVDIAQVIADIQSTISTTGGDSDEIEWTVRSDMSVLADGTSDTITTRYGWIGNWSWILNTTS